jgi:hypothetical protein
LHYARILLCVFTNGARRQQEAPAHTTRLFKKPLPELSALYTCFGLLKNHPPQIPLVFLAAYGIILPLGNHGLPVLQCDQTYYFARKYAASRKMDDREERGPESARICDKARFKT